MKTKLQIEGRLTVVKALMNDHKYDIEELKKERVELRKQLNELPKTIHLEEGDYTKIQLTDLINNSYE